MLLVNSKGRIVDVSEDLASELLAHQEQFEIYTGQLTTRFGAKVYGQKEIGQDAVKENLKENEDFNPGKIKWIDPENVKGYPVDSAFSARQDEKEQQKEDEIFELKKMLKETIKEKEEETDDGMIPCKKCGKTFSAPTKNYKYCEDCRK